MTVICQETEGSGIIEGRAIKGRYHRAVLQRQLVLCTHQLRVIYTVESSTHWLRCQSVEGLKRDFTEDWSVFQLIRKM